MSVFAAYPWVENCPGCKVRQGGAVVDFRCPLCGGFNGWAKLQGSGKLALGCHRGCDTAEVLRALGQPGYTALYPDAKVPETARREVTATYPYFDEAGTLLYATDRLEPGRNGRPKEFRQKRPKPGGGWEYSLGDVRRVLYRLPGLLAADPERLVFVVSGEKDADSLAAIGCVATTNVCGERSEWLDSYTEALRGRQVVVVEDADATGRRHANEVCGSLLTAAKTLRRLTLPCAKDATAFLNRLRTNGTRDPNALQAALWAAVCDARLWA